MFAVNAVRPARGTSVTDVCAVYQDSGALGTTGSRTRTAKPKTPYH